MSGDRDLTMPMFPLGSVLLPGAILPLHVFERRYRVLVRHVLDGDREFGVCLIERGFEVGGGDVRASVGTVARVHEAAELPDGRWALVTVGTRRIEVVDWLEDDPYPRARVRDLPDPAPAEDELVLLEDTVALLRRALAKLGELGDAAAPATFELSADPVLASHQLCAIAPVSTLDRHQLLASPTVGLRLARLHDLVTEAESTLDLRLALEAGEDEP